MEERVKVHNSDLPYLKSTLLSDSMQSGLGHLELLQFKTKCDMTWILPVCQPYKNINPLLNMPFYTYAENDL